MIEKIISLSVGGIAGTLSRYFLSTYIYRILGSAFPFGTMVVNIIGCLVIGLLLSLSETKFMLGPSEKLMLMVGFCGAFTTFSSFILETDALVKNGQYLFATLNILLSLALCYFAYRIGVKIGEIV